MRPFIVTIIGAESTGKTTLSRQLADTLCGDWICEFARPYLEVTDGRVTRQSMDAIWKGQLALEHIATQSPRRFIVQDTDLYATVGYWQLPHIEPKIGTCPAQLVSDAVSRMSDLYIVTKSNIPFEQDPLRYGGTERESSDTYWIRLCQDHLLPYIILESTSMQARLAEAITYIKERSALCAA